MMAGVIQIKKQNEGIRQIILEKIEKNEVFECSIIDLFKAYGLKAQHLLKYLDKYGYQTLYSLPTAQGCKKPAECIPKPKKYKQDQVSNIGELYNIYQIQVSSDQNNEGHDGEAEFNEQYQSYLEGIGNLYQCSQLQKRHGELGNKN